MLDFKCNYVVPSFLVTDVVFDVLFFAGRTHVSVKCTPRCDFAGCTKSVHFPKFSGNPCRVHLVPACTTADALPRNNFGKVYSLVYTFRRVSITVYGALRLYRSDSFGAAVGMSLHKSSMTLNATSQTKTIWKQFQHSAILVRMRSSLVESNLPVLITFAVVAVRNVKTYIEK